jgi:hypothetical protein
VGVQASAPAYVALPLTPTGLHRDAMQSTSPFQGEVCLWHALGILNDRACESQ